MDFGSDCILGEVETILSCLVLPPRVGGLKLGQLAFRFCVNGTPDGLGSIS
jgi:hypothetical protein